ncbi:MAG: succinate dehydrogenase cytochrome b subunit [Cyclobacteriaceae bacterium]
MSSVKSIFASSLGKKYIMAITGLGLTLFLFGHLGGNFLLFKSDGGEAFNAYAHFMKTTPIIWVSEIVIFSGLIFHIVDGIALVFANKKARPVDYAYKKGGSNQTSWASKKMGLLGTLLLIFLILHLANFFMKTKILPDDGSIPKYILADGTEVADLFLMVKVYFQNIIYVTIYVVCMIGLSFHLSHGVQSAFQSLGLKNKKVSPIIQKVGLLIAFIVPLLFASIPVYFYVTQSI